MKHRVLIVGTVPYNPNMTSRSFESYFHNWDRENLAQIFSHPKTPIKGHCSTLFQITDQMMLKRFFGNRHEQGRIYQYEELPNEWADNNLEVDSNLINNLYKAGKRKSPLKYLLRGLLWRKRFWCTQKLNKWLEEFKPECVFLSFSDDYFIPEIALYVSKKFNIPIVSSIGDDYYFNYKFSLSPLYHIYKLTYRNLIRKVLKRSAGVIYIGNKIRDKYNSEFSLNGETVYLTSEVASREFKEINTDNPIISYFGNIRLGRNKSLDDIANALGKINKNYKLNIYSNENDKRYFNFLKKNPNINYSGAILYSEVLKKISQSDILIHVEGFKKKDVDITRYSLSTKIADLLASGVCSFAYGSIECGAIEYAQESAGIATCTNKDQLEDTLKRLIFDKEYQRELVNKALQISKTNHSLNKSASIFEDEVRKAIFNFKTLRTENKDVKR